MPPRRGRRASPPVLILEDEDLDFEVSYSEGEDGEDSSSSSSGEEPEEGTDVEDGERSDEGEEEEEEEGQEESVAEGCGPAVQARVPGGAAAERAANAPTCPVCMEPWTSEGEHRIR
jgi:E3 ubiquitin-protein ligase RFWD3